MYADSVRDHHRNEIAAFARVGQKYRIPHQGRQQTIARYGA